ncbi:hypothetical protein CRYUN_Cryun28dG0014400 [Craigia yunnanensis]
MENSITQDLCESFQLNDDYQYLKDEETDESNFIYIINAILSETARLNVLLPIATILAFTIFAPLLTNDGQCTSLSRWLMGSHSDVVACYYPGIPKKVTNNVPLVVGFVVSVLFVVFPSKRRKIGYTFLLQREARNSRV